MNSKSAVGAPLTRVDGRLKVTGQARYAADTPVRGLAHAVLVPSTIARGEITELDATRAEAAPGVLLVASHRNRPPLRWDAATSIPPFGQRRLPLADATVHHAGQHIAVVVAETLEQARHAASLVRVEYRAERPAVGVRAHLHQAVPLPGQEANTPDRGDAEAALRVAPVRVAGTFHSPMAHHVPLEPSATVAAWSGGRLTVHESTQSIQNTRAALALALGVPEADIRVITPFVGGGFGCKGTSWPHTSLAAAVARMTGRPVKLVLTRAQTFTSHGHRAELLQELELGADHDGRLTAVRHRSTGQTSPFDQVVSDVIEPTGTLYACPNVTDLHRTVALNLGNPAYMRSPESPAVHALEVLLDELSVRLGIDPVELRRRNHAGTDQRHGDVPFGERKHLLECYDRGAELFGWKDRTPAPRSMRRDGTLVGLGMATSVHSYWRNRAQARVTLGRDGRAVAQSGTQDIGTGTYTVMTQVAADGLGVRPRDVRFELGDTALPPAPVSASSTTAVSVGNAVHAAAADARRQAVALAVADPASPLHGRDPAAITAADGRLFERGRPSRGETYARLLTRNGRTIVGEGATVPAGGARREFGGYSFGAVFAEVGVDEAIGRVRVTRLTGVFDVGRVLNARTARSQVIGGMIWGLGQALMEASAVDPHRGRIVTANLSGYLVPVEADVPDIDAHLIDRPDPGAGALGARGMGEVPATGVSAAIANAVHHATGKRVRDLPITPDRLL